MSLVHLVEAEHARLLGPTDGSAHVGRGDANLKGVSPRQRKEPVNVVRASGCRGASDYSDRSSWTRLSRHAHFTGNAAASAARGARHARRPARSPAAWGLSLPDTIGARSWRVLAVVSTQQGSAGTETSAVRGHYVFRACRCCWGCP